LFLYDLQSFRRPAARWFDSGEVLESGGRTLRHFEQVKIAAMQLKKETSVLEIEYWAQGENK